MADPLILLVLLLIILVVILAIWVSRLRARPLAAPSLATILIAPELAQAGAAKGLADYGLTTRADWRPYLEQPLAPQQPVAVQRLDRVDPSKAYYYLVPYGTDPVKAVALVDGLTGEYLEAKPMPTGLKRPWNPAAIEARTKSRQGRSVGAREYAFWVWRPCVESRSLFFPFRLMFDGGSLRYIRVDGKEFDRLTELGPGGSTGHPPSYGPAEPDSKA